MKDRIEANKSKQAPSDERSRTDTKKPVGGSRTEQNESCNSGKDCS